MLTIARKSKIKREKIKSIQLRRPRKTKTEEEEEEEEGLPAFPHFLERQPMGNK